MPSKEEKMAFYKEICRVMEDTEGELNWIEAVVHYCDKNGVEIEVATTLVNDKLKKRLEESATNHNYLKKDKKLDV